MGAGQIVVMDNLSVHTSAWVRELVEGKGAQVLKWEKAGASDMKTALG